MKGAWGKEIKQKFFRLDQIIWKQTNRVEKRSIITVCKYLVNRQSSAQLVFCAFVIEQCGNDWFCQG